MRCTLFCMLEVFLVNPLLYVGQTQETNRPVVTIHPNWPKMYAKERITLKCEIKNGGNDGWEYEWKTSSSIIPPKKRQYMIKSASNLHSGSYGCAGRNQSHQRSSTQWSPDLKLTIYLNAPMPVLTVSPSWLSPGALVNLSCGGLEHPSAGWKFYWFKAVPKDTGSSYRRIPLHASKQKRQSSISVRGQEHTTGYLCRATRGDSVSHTQYSAQRFIWSGDFSPTVNLTVNPDRVQHFSSESVSLSCEGNSSKWRVMRFTETGLLSHCYDWGTMTGSTCHISHLQYRDAVYWCESASGDVSNAVNITVHLSRPESSPSLVLLLTGVLPGAVLVILLLLVYRYIKSKDPSSDRPEQPQSTDLDKRVDPDATQEHIYASPLEGDLCTYDTIGGCKDMGNGGYAKEVGDDATFHSIQLKGIDEKSEREDPVESSDYYNV